MAKMKQDQITVLFVLVLIAAGAYLMLGGATGAIGIITPSTGFSTISVDTVDFTSNDPSLNGPAYLLTTSVDGGAEYATGTYSNLGELKFQEPFTITMNMTKNDCSYGIVDMGEVLYAPSVKVASYCPYNGAPPSSYTSFTCASQGGMPAMMREYTSSQFDCGYDGQYRSATKMKICWYYMPYYRVGNVDTAAVYDWNLIVGIERSGEVDSTTINPMQTSSLLGDIGRVKTIGSLVGSQTCPAAAANTVTVRNASANTTKYILANYMTYSIYRNQQLQVPAFPVSCDPIWSYQNPDGTWRADPRVSGYSCITTLSSQATQMINTLKTMNVTSSSVICESQTIVNDTSVSDARYVCTPSQAVVYPVTQVILKADWLGVGVNVGTPEIVEISGTPVFEVDTTFYPMKIKNLADVPATFDVKVECGTEITLGRAVRASYEPGETKTVNLELQGVSGTYTCDVTAYDVNNPSMEDTVQYTFTIMKQPCPFACCLSDSSYMERSCAPMVCEDDSFKYTDIEGETIEVLQTKCYEQYCSTDFECHRGALIDTFNTSCGSCSTGSSLQVQKIGEDAYYCYCVPASTTQCTTDANCGANAKCMNSICVTNPNPITVYPTTPGTIGIEPGSTENVVSDIGEALGIDLSKVDPMYLIGAIAAIVVIAYFLMFKGKKRRK